MKRCTTCNRTFTDPNLRFCIDDGTPLTDVAPEDDATVVSPRHQDDSWNTAAYQPPGSYVPPPGTERKRRRMWPWLVGLGGAFILGILVIAIAGTMLVSRMARREHPRITVRQPENSNAAPPETNANTANEDVDAPAPTDHDQVLTQLKDIENEWTVANLNADKKKLDRILADDFVGEGPDGQPQSKSEYIRTIQRDTTIDKWEFGNLKLALTGDRATLTGTITFFSDNRKAAFDFTDKFVWRDGRWQSTGSVVKQMGTPGVDL
jgi:Domain of unknown function (DUF4440)